METNMTRIRSLWKPLFFGIVFLVSLGQGREVSAGTNSWTSNGPEGGIINSLAIHPSTPSTLYAGFYGGGVFKSVDSGGAWHSSNIGLANLDVHEVTINPVIPSTVYAGTSNSVYKSTNDGESWTKASTGLNASVGSLIIDPTTPNTLYAGTGSSGIYKSTNGGENWTEANTGLSSFVVSDLAINPSTTTTLYAAVGIYGVYKSTNGGGNWNLANNGLPAIASPSALVINPIAPSTLYLGLDSVGGIYTGGVYKTTNSGGNWTAVNTGLTDIDIRALAIDPVTPNTLYAATDGGGVFKSTNGGGNWNAININLTVFRLASLAINPLDSDTLYAGTFGGVFTSTNGGEDWSAANDKLIGTSVWALAINPVNPDILYAGTHMSGAFQTTDSGSIWNSLPIDLVTSTGYALAVDPAAPNTVYIGTSPNGIYKSADGGVSWNPSNTGLSRLYVTALAIDPGTPSTLYAGTDIGGFKSTNGGEKWNTMYSDLTNADIRSLVVNPTTPTTLYAGTQDGIFRSMDSGVNWTEYSYGLTNTYVLALAIDPETPSTLYGGTYGGGVYKSTNSGLSWSPVNTGLTNTIVNTLAVDPVTPTILYAGTNDGVFRSTDGGGNWSPFNSGLANRRVHSLVINPVTPSILYAGTDGGVFSIQHTPPGGFNKSNPSNGSSATTHPTLSWGVSSNTNYYIYCVDTIDDSICDTSWIPTGISTSVSLSGLTNNETYYWFVAAINDGGVTYADGGTWWSFTTVPPAPGAFSKGAPELSSVQPLDPTLSWAASAGADDYEYCVDTTNDGACSASWVSAGSSTSAGLSGLSNNSTYYWQVRANNEGGTTYADGGSWWSFRTPIFADVPYNHTLRAYIEAFYNAGITTGCGTGPLIFCPDTAVTRAAMAVFLLRAEHGSAYAPPAASHYFSDMPVAGKEWQEAWVDQFYREGITGGCGTGPLIYCPETSTTRASMAVFILRAKYGSSYTPPAASHFFADMPVAGKEWMEPWVDELYREVITSGCGTGPLIYCPESSVKRQAMAAFIVRAFNLPMP
jgi:photosystem II stability/assembly factor-like uncharacterized protein